MKGSEPVKIGRLLKTFGTEGQLRCHIQERFLPLIRKDVFLWIELDGLLVPFQISKYISQNKALIYFKDVHSEYMANQLSGNWIYVKPIDFPGHQLTEEAPGQVEYSYLEGYEVRISGNRMTGKVTSIQDYPGQEMAFVDFGIEDTEDVLIPLVEEFISRIDKQAKFIEFDLPQGFFDL